MLAQLLHLQKNQKIPPTIGIARKTKTKTIHLLPGRYAQGVAWVYNQPAWDAPPTAGKVRSGIRRIKPGSICCKTKT